MPRSSAEYQIQKACVHWLHIQEGHGRLAFFAVPNGGNRSAVTGALLKATGTRAGVPDLVVLFSGGHALFIEIKATSGRLQQTQIEWRDRLQDMGFSWAECRSLDELISAIERAEQRRR